MAGRWPCPDLTLADQLLPCDEWIENRTRMTMIERCPAPLSNQVRLRVRALSGAWPYPTVGTEGR
jgi:hypothetical protein